VDVARGIKRAFDVVGSAVGLVVASPILLGGALAIRWTLGPPAFFRQERLGLGGKPFRLIKFRTMSDARDRDGKLLPDEQRLNRVGRFIRSSSLDELPQLWNVLKGEMSLVGPRPLLLQYLPRYSPEQARRHSVRPGLTGWTQVHGRNANTWEEKFDLDLWYLNHWSLWVDAKVIGLTILRVIERQGITNEGHATMPEFMGNAEPTSVSSSPS
jgi:sugar transferase EpsL